MWEVLGAIALNLLQYDRLPSLKECGLMSNALRLWSHVGQPLQRVTMLPVNIHLDTICFISDNVLLARDWGHCYIRVWDISLL